MTNKAWNRAGKLGYFDKALFSKEMQTTEPNVLSGMPEAFPAMMSASVVAVRFCASILVEKVPVF